MYEQVSDVECYLQVQSLIVREEENTEKLGESVIEFNL